MREKTEYYFYSPFFLVLCQYFGHKKSNFFILNDCIILNFANTDMVGHTGSLPAAIKAVEAVDECVGKIVKLVEEKQGNLIITADHGNAEQMIDYKTGEYIK